MVILVLHSSNNVPTTRKISTPKSEAKGIAGNCRHKIQNTRLTNQNVDQLSYPDHVNTKAHSSQGKAQLYSFEDNEALIRMIIEGRSTMMRHVSRTKIQIKYVDTKNQLADLLTKGSFTRDEWCNLLCLVNIMNLSMFSRSHVRSVEKATTMSKRIQERKKEEEPSEAKPRSVCLVSASLNKGQYSSFGPGVSNIPENPQMDSGSVEGAAGNCRQNSVEGAAGNCRQDSAQGAVLDSSKGVVGNCNKRLKSNYRRPGWTTTTCKSQNM